MCFANIQKANIESECGKLAHGGKVIRAYASVNLVSTVAVIYPRRKGTFSHGKACSHTGIGDTFNLHGDKVV